ncbi:MAG: DUF2975 domain-containing protein [Burkholderiales bacterium]
MGANDKQAALRARIVWPCRVIRAAAIAYAAWGLLRAAGFWSDADLVARAYAGWYGGQPALADAARRVAGFGVSLAIWAMVVAAVIAVWRLTGHYLSGRVFTVDASVALKRIGQLGLAATALDLAARPVVRALLSPGAPFDAHFLSRWVRPEDLLYVAMFAALWVLAHLLESAASLSDEVEQFV